MKKLLQICLIIVAFSLTANAETKNTTINIYGVGEKLNDKTYNGVGLEYNNDFTKIVVEGGDKHKKASAVVKGDVSKELYIKGGFGYLKKEITDNGTLKDVTQNSSGVGVGYGDDKSYNLEVGYIENKLDGTTSADTTTKIKYLEAIYMKNSFDVVGVYKNTKAYDKDYDDSSLDVGYYPIKDLRVSAKYDSIVHDTDNYVAKVGMQYIFDTKEWKPFASIEKYSNKNVSFALNYSHELQNKALNMRDVFEEIISTSEIVAQSVAPSEFASKSSAITIAMANQTVNDVGGAVATDLTAPIVTNVDNSAVYSIVSDPTGGKLTINSSTGVATWHGNLFSTTNYNITIKVVNTDSRTSSTTFILTVNDNG